MIIEAEYEEVEDAAEAAETTEAELDLSEDDSLPWLEADEEDEGRSGVDIAQIIGFALILAVVAGVLLSALYYFTNRSADGAPVADGSTIEAPEGPLRERPEDPGGREFAGTGDVAPVVGEGGTREGVMDTDGTGAAGAENGDRASADSANQAGSGSEASNDGAGANANSDADANSGSAGNASSASGVGVQLAAYTSRARAEQGWNDLSRRTNALDGVRYRIEQGQVDIGTVYRLQAVASDRAAADRLCAALRADGLDCQVKP